MAKALITIIGHQKFDDDKDQVEMKTVGTFEHDDDNYIIRLKTAPLRFVQSLTLQRTKARLK